MHRHLHNRPSSGYLHPTSIPSLQMIRRPARRALLLSLLLSPLIAQSQTPQATLPSGTPLPVMIDKHLPMRAGQPVRAQLIYPVYADNTVILPEKTVLIGTVTELRSNHSQRVNARLNGDFTPFHIPVVRFTQVILTDGTSLPLTTATATNGAPIFRLVAPAPRKGGFIRKQWDSGVQILHDQVAVFTAPAKGDRLLQLFYHQLPYHPERIEKGTAWTVETAEPLTIPPQTNPSATAASKSTPVPPSKPTVTTDESGRPTWTIQAYLRDELTSATAKSSQPIKAIVAEPVYNPDHTIAVPQGATIIGAITQAKPVVPLILVLLATRPLDQEHGSNDMAGKNFVGANGFGLAGNLFSLAGGSPNVAAGIGAYGAAVSLYRRWIAHGHEVTFARDTRLVLQTTPRTAAVLKPASH